MLENEGEFRPDVRARKKINGEQRSSTFFCPLSPAAAALSSLHGH
jgi:hypothetical protein